MSNNTKERILLAAKDEFMAKGFLAASLRTIAQKSGVTVSNIYRYFGHKDSLFTAVLQPLLDELDTVLSSHNSDFQMELYYGAQQEYEDINSELFLNLIHRYRPELKLLLAQSAGSSLEDYTEILLDRQVAFGCEYLKRYQEKYPHLEVRQVSPLFMRIFSSWWVTILREIATNDHLTAQEMDTCISEYMVFGIAGWNAFMNSAKKTNK